MYSLTTQRPVAETRLFGIREQLQLLLDEVGTSRFKEAVQRTIETYTGDFFPTIGIIRSNLRTQTGGADKNGRTWRRDPNCSKCHGTGWIYVDDPKADELYKQSGHKATVRCRQEGCLQWLG